MIPALTVREPFASLIVSGAKQVENRPKPLGFRGRLAIHAGKQLHELAPLVVDAPPSQFSAVLGTVQVVGCHKAGECCRDVGGFRPGEFGLDGIRWHWELDDARQFVTPIPRVKGALGFWTPDDSTGYLIEIAEVLS